jgi:hypothetical protein
VTPGTVQVGYANNWGAAPVAGTPIEALIQANGWYTFTTTYLRSGNQTTEPAVQISEVLSPCGMLLGYEIGVGIYFAAESRVATSMALIKSLLNLINPVLLETI